MKIETYNDIKTLLIAGRTWKFISDDLHVSMREISKVKKDLVSDGIIIKKLPRNTTTTNKKYKDVVPGQIKFLPNLSPYEINELTKYRFIAELMGYKGTSLTIGGYKSWIKKNI